MLATQHRGGSGGFVLHVDTKTGVVTSVDVEKSTRFLALDECSVTAFRHWQFQPPIRAKIKISVTFDPSAKKPIVGQMH